MRGKYVDLGKVGVDSGAILICDPCQAETLGRKWLEVVDRDGVPEQGQFMEWGVLLESGIGDGFYNVTARIDDTPFGRRNSMAVIDFFNPDQFRQK